MILSHRSRIPSADPYHFRSAWCDTTRKRGFSACS